MRNGEAKLGSWAWLLFAAVGALAASVFVVGLVERSPGLIVGGMVFLLWAACLMLWNRATRLSPGGHPPSVGEKAAWSQISAALAAIMGLCAMAGSGTEGVFAGWLFFVAYALIVVFRPVFRRRFGQEDLRLREVTADERDGAILAQGDYWSRRFLELALVALAVVWLAFPDSVRDLRGPMQIAAAAFIPVLMASVVGEARVAWLYWRDRRI